MHNLLFNHWRALLAGLLLLVLSLRFGVAETFVLVSLVYALWQFKRGRVTVTAVSAYYYKQVKPRLNSHFPAYYLLTVSLLGAFVLFSYRLGVWVTLAALCVIVWTAALYLSRRRVVNSYTLRRFSKRVEAAFLASGVKENDAPPAVWVDKVPGAYACTVRVPVGSSTQDVSGRIDRVANIMRLRFSPASVSIPRPGFVNFRLLDAHNPLDEEQIPPAPAIGRSFAHPCPLGVDEQGAPLSVSLYGRSLLIGGSPGSGKSVAAWNVLLHAAADPATVLLVCDLKPHGIETAPLHQRANVVATTPAACLSAFRQVLSTIDARNLSLLTYEDSPLEKTNPDLGDIGAPIVIFVDEAAELSYTDDGKQALEMLQRIVAIGRSAGVCVILCTQKPSGTIIPTSLRDLMGYRMAFRTGSRAQSVVILGEEGLQQGAEPQAIPVESPGLGFCDVSGKVQAFKGYNWDRELIIAACKYITHHIDKDEVSARTFASLSPDPGTPETGSGNGSAGGTTKRRRR